MRADGGGPAQFRRARPACRRRQPIDYALVNPYAFADPISPHLAAADAQATIEPWHIAEAFTRLQAQADFVVVEGVGGWLAPLANQ